MVFAVILILLSIQAGIAQQDENLFFVFLNTNPDKPKISQKEIEDLQKQHLANLDRLANEGKLLAAGPFEGGGGLVVLQCEDLETANNYIFTDPAVKAQRFKIEIYPLSLLTNAVCGAKEPYEMVTYQFIRFYTNQDWKGNRKKMSASQKDFINDLNNTGEEIVVYASFNDLDEGLLILDSPSLTDAESLAKKLPSVTSGQLTYTAKELWIAKGTFCKK